MTRLTWPTVGLTGVVGAIAIGLAALGWPAGDVIAVAAVLAGISGGAIAGGAAASGVTQRVDERVDALQAETSAQTETLQVLDRRTNGELQERLDTAAERAAEQASARTLAVLREQGVIR